MYLEHFRGNNRQRTWGLLAWLAAGLLRSLWSGNCAAVFDRASLLTECLERVNLDSGSMDLAWLLTLEGEPLLQGLLAEVGRRGRQPATAAEEEEAQQTGGGATARGPKPRQGRPTNREEKETNSQPGGRHFCYDLVFLHSSLGGGVALELCPPLGRIDSHLRRGPRYRPAVRL